MTLTSFPVLRHFLPKGWPQAALSPSLLLTSTLSMCVSSPFVYDPVIISECKCSGEIWMRPDFINLVICYIIHLQILHWMGSCIGTRNPLFLMTPNFSTTISKTEVLIKNNEQVYQKKRGRQFSIFNQIRHHIKIGFNEILLFFTLLSEYWISCNIAQI